jgi:multidrug resistance efflux pump
MQRRLDTAKGTRANLDAQLAELNANIEAEKAARPETVGAFAGIARNKRVNESPMTCLIFFFRARSQQERVAALENLSVTRKELTKLENELSDYGGCDPVKIEDKKRGVILAKEASFRWTGT